MLLLQRLKKSSQQVALLDVMVLGRQYEPRLHWCTTLVPRNLDKVSRKCQSFEKSESTLRLLTGGEYAIM